jgi:hypothetical protein
VARLVAEVTDFIFMPNARTLERSVARSLGRWLVKPPGQFPGFYERVSEVDPGVFTPAYATLGTGGLDSIHAL